MMRYTVTWHREAEDELMELWLVATDRNEITAAVRASDRRRVGNRCFRKGGNSC